MASDTARCAHMTCLTYCPSRGGSVAHGRQSVLKKTDWRPCAALGWWRTDSVAGAAEDGGCGGWLRSACRAILAAAIAPRTDAHPFSGENGSVSVRGSARSQTTALRHLSQSRRTMRQTTWRRRSHAAVRRLIWLMSTKTSLERKRKRSAESRASGGSQQGDAEPHLLRAEQCNDRKLAMRPDAPEDRFQALGSRSRPL